jgi:hypothetical protein
VIPTRNPPSGREHAFRVLAIAAVFVIALLLRWATLSSLTGDDHYLLWAATNFLNGDRPLRDFVELGAPLYWAMSALGQVVTGHRVIGEVGLGTLLVAFAFAVSFHLAWRASGSLLLAAGATALALLVMTQRELYNYTKLFIYPLGVWLCWRYIDRPTLSRAVVLALGVAAAWGYRHDHGAYMGVGAAAAVLAAHWREGVQRVATGWLRFGVALLALLAPYLIYIQVNEGIAHYIQERVHLARVIDATSRRPVWFTVDRSAPDYWFRIEPPRPARVFVEWKPEVSNADRVTLEKKYSLTNGVDPKKSLYEYLLSDVSPANLKALATDPHIADRRDISVSYREESGSKVIDEVIATEPPPANAPPAARAVVEIQWKDELSDHERAGLERQYGLLDNRSKWEYALADIDTDNIRALVNDPHVYDTGLIDQDSFRPMEESWLVALQRAIPLFRIGVAPRYWHAQNAGIALHFLSLSLPYLMLIALAIDWYRGRRREFIPHGPEKMCAAAVMMMVAHYALLRRDGYFADHVAVAVILAGCLWGHAFAGPAGEPRRRRAFPAIAAALMLCVATYATVTYASPLAVASTLGIGEGGFWNTSAELFRRYNASPAIDGYAPAGSTGDRGLIRYVYECTRPSDRIWVLSDLFTFPYYAERSVVGHIYWQAGLAANPDFERRMIAKVDTAEVPLVLALGGKGPLDYLNAYPLVQRYVAQRYTTRIAVPDENAQREQVFWLLTDSRRQPSGTYDLLGLPCFK